MHFAIVFARRNFSELQVTVENIEIIEIIQISQITEERSSVSKHQMQSSYHYFACVRYVLDIM
jgi:hypothetical protein